MANWRNWPACAGWLPSVLFTRVARRSRARDHVGRGSPAQGIHILPRKHVTKPGKEVGPGAITTIPGINGNFAVSHRITTEGDLPRTQCSAKWLSNTDPNNPLTWRVMANRRVAVPPRSRARWTASNDYGKIKANFPRTRSYPDYLAHGFARTSIVEEAPQVNGD